MKLNILERYPNFSHLYHRIIQSEKLKDILDEYKTLPDLTQIHNESDEFDQFNSIDDNFLKEVDDIVIKSRNKDDYFDEMSKEEKLKYAEQVTQYINHIIALVALLARLTNNIDVKDITSKISARLSLLLPSNLKKMIKISLDLKMKKNNKIQRLIKTANKLDLEGKNIAADEIDAEIKRVIDDNESKIDPLLFLESNDDNKDISYSLEFITSVALFELVNWLGQMTLEFVTNLILEKGYKHTIRYLAFKSFLKMLDDDSFSLGFLEDKGWVSLKKLRVDYDMLAKLSEEEKEEFIKDVGEQLFNKDNNPLNIDVNLILKEKIDLKEKELKEEENEPE